MVMNHQVKTNLHLILTILICNFPMVSVSFLSAMKRQSEYTGQKLYGHIEACQVTAALSLNLLEKRPANFDSNHSQYI